MDEPPDYLIDVSFDDSFMLKVKLQLRYPVPPEIQGLLEVDANKAAGEILNSFEYMHSPELEKKIIEEISKVVDEYLYKKNYIEWGKSPLGQFYRRLLESYPNWNPGNL